MRGENNELVSRTKNKPFYDVTTRLDQTLLACSERENPKHELLQEPRSTKKCFLAIFSDTTIAHPSNTALQTMKKVDPAGGPSDGVPKSDVTSDYLLQQGSTGNNNDNLKTHSSGSQSSSSKRSNRKRPRGKPFSIAPDPPQNMISTSFETFGNISSDTTYDTATDGLPRSSWSWKNHHHHSNREDRSDTDHISSLMGALILVSLLGALAGLDAKNECLEHETNALMTLIEDEDEIDDSLYDDMIQYQQYQKQYNVESYEDAYDQAYLREAQNGCIRLFQQVMLPAVLVTVLMGLVALLLLRRSYKRRTLGPTEAMNLSLRLLVLAYVILAAQAYNITYIMLSPRFTQNDFDSENPFHSLAAVDVLGHVSDNANLYYLTWLSGSLALALSYQTTTATIRAYRAVQVFRRDSNLLPATSWYILSTYEDEESRHAWYKSVYRLRIRTGVWTAAFVACLVVTASAQFIWKETLWPYVLAGIVEVANGNNNNNDDDDMNMNGDDNDVNGDDAVVQQDDDAMNQADEIAQTYQDYMESLRSMHFSVCQTVHDESDGEIPVNTCRRTGMAWMAGVLGMILCAVAIGIHKVGQTSAANQPTPSSPTGVSQVNVFERLLQNHRVPLGAEMILSFIVSGILGYNTIFATSKQGPASSVGNLYYASWISFLLLIRICLGCVEEWFQVEDSNESGVPPTTKPTADKKKNYTAPTLDNPQENNDSIQERIAEEEEPDGLIAQSPTNNTNQTGDISHNSSSSRLVDQFEKERKKRLRIYFCLSIFSTVCWSAAYDAAVHEEQALNKTQKYIVLAPAIVAVLSLILFVTCLSRQCYLFTSHFYVGGILSVILFGLWMADLVLTMHSEESWAVNKIGEIKMANLYYFSWASILTAGLNLMSYVEAMIGLSKNDTMSIVWIGICKVCFVIFGAGMHIWPNISDKCDINSLQTGAVTFCSRTVLAIIVSITGMLVGGFVVTIRFFQKFLASCQCPRVQAHIEIILSSFLVLLFATCVALITGIGGPGQSVGDLYYSTWLAFAVALGIFLHCYEQITHAERESSHNQAHQPPEMQVSDSVLV